MRHRLSGRAVHFLSTVRNTLDTKTEHCIGHGHGYVHQGKEYLAFPWTLHDAVIVLWFQVTSLNQLESTRSRARQGFVGQRQH